MTPPIITSSQPKEQPKVTLNAGLQAGVKAYGVDKIPVFGATGGAKVEYKGFHAGAELTAGTALGGNIEVGKEFDINKNWGLDLSANASHTVSTLGKSQNAITHNIEGEVNSISSKWRPGVSTAGVKAMANYKSNNGKLNFGAGVSGQYVKNNAADITLSTRIEKADGNTQMVFSSVKANKKGIVVSPELQAEYKISNNFVLKGSANALGATASVAWTF